MIVAGALLWRSYRWAWLFAMQSLALLALIPGIYNEPWRFYSSSLISTLEVLSLMLAHRRVFIILANHLSEDEPLPTPMRLDSMWSWSSRESTGT
jgi:hypothetical protein